MAKKSIQMKHSNNGVWDELYPITTSDNIIHGDVTLPQELDIMSTNLQNEIAKKPNTGEVAHHTQTETTTGRWWSETITHLVDSVGHNVISKKGNTKQKIVFLGSSTVEGTGTTDRPNTGFVSLLKNRLEPLGFEVINRGVGGDNTQDAINRFLKDIVPLQADFVVVGLTIGNEGINDTTNYKEVIQQFKKGIYRLVGLIKKYGSTPIIINQAPTNRYNETIYNMMKQFNDELENSSIMTIDIMGAVDTLTGTPFPSIMTDSLHYNDRGHQEFLNSFPPTMFDMLKDRDNKPFQTSNNHILLGSPTSDTPIEFNPTYSLTTFTTFMRFRLTDSPTLSSLISFNSTNRIALSNVGRVMIYIPSNDPNETEHFIDDNEWHTMAVTYSSISGALRVYLDKQLIHSSTTFDLVLSQMAIAGRPGSSLPMPNLAIKDVAIYRSRFRQAQVDSLHEGIFHQGSLELYSPLNDKVTTRGVPLINLAPTNENLFINNMEDGFTSN